MSKLKNHFIVNGLREERNFQSWVDNQVGERKAKVFTDKGLEPYVVSFTPLGKWKSTQQNKTFHCLLSLFYRSGCYSQTATSVDDLKAYYKNKVGLIDYYLYYDGKKIVKAKKVEDIPEWINTRACRIILKSWSTAKKGQATLGIDLLVKDMINSKINQTTYGKEFDNILQGMDNR